MKNNDYNQIQNCLTRLKKVRDVIMGQLIGEVPIERK